MSTSIDQKIVSMKFDNKQFESGVSDSLKTISKLEKSLDLPNSSKGLNGISDAIKRVSFDSMSNGIEAVKIKFSALEVMAVTALANITNSAINTGKRLVSSLMIDPITDGYADYGRKLTSIQTITNATGKSIKEVNKYFDDLDIYADKTVYNLDDMTSALAKFTNAGVDLDKSVPAIKGIANMTALAGQDAGAAQIAMYNLSQSIAGGFLTRTDFKSLELANVATKEWKDQMIQGAIAAGTLKDAGNGMYQATGAKEAVTAAALFTEELKTGWATTEVMLDVLGKYGDTNTEIGKKAQSAAQDVKSFSMMMETLKASVGTGWTDTFEILIGDLEESKALFTPLTNTIGGILDATSKARNELLGGWKDLGGRTVLIDSIKNAFNGLKNIVMSVGEAFREIFPKTTSQQLYNFTIGLKNLSEYFKMSDENLKNLKSTFKGVFAILDIGKTIILAVANAIKILLVGTGNLLSNVLGVTASFGEWMVALDQTIKQSDIFNKVLSKIAYTIKSGFEGVSYVLNVVVGAIGSVVTALGNKINIPGLEGVHTFLNLLGRRMTFIGDEANKLSVTVGGAFVKMGEAIIGSKVGMLFSSLWETVKKVSHAVSVLVNRMVDSISTSFQNADFSVILDAVAGISIGGMLLSFKKFMKGLSETVKSSKGLFGNIKGILDDVRGSLEAYQQNLKAGVLTKLAIAMALLAASLVAISIIDSGKLVSSLAAIGTLFAQLMVAMKIFSIISDSKRKMTKASAVMITMSLSILILSSAMKKLASLDWNGVAKGTVGISALAGVLVTSSKILATNDKAVIKGAASMVVFALAVKVLASACITLSTLSWNGITKGLVGVGILMTEISLFLKTAKFSGKTISTAIGITILAGAMKILASACRDFGELSWESIGKGLSSIGALLLEISIFSKLTSKSKNIISTGIGIIAIATAMKILASAMSDFGGMQWDAIGRGLTVMAGALIEIVIAMRLMPKNLIVTASGLVIVGAALNILASALVKMGNMSWDAIGKGITILGSSLCILAIALHTMKKSTAGSVALLIAAGALAILAPVLSLLGAMSWESIIKGLVSLGGAISIFGIAATLLTPVIPSMLALSGSLALLGLAMVGIGAGLALVGVGLSGVAAGFTLLAGVTSVGATAIVTSLGIIITGVAALIPAIMAKIGEGIVAFCKVFSDSIPAILECLSTILKAIVDFIVVNTPMIINAVIKILTLVLDALIVWIPTIVQKVVDLMLAFLKVIDDSVPKVVTAATNIIISFVKSIGNNLNRIVDSAFKLIISFINGLADAVRNNSSAIADACYNLVTAVVDGIGSLGGRFVDAGIYAVEGFVKGLLSVPGKIWNAGKELGKKALAAAENALDINSPSREFAELGMYSALGFANGLSDYSDNVQNEASSMGFSVIDSLKNAISNISDIVNGNIDMNPTIRPVLDLGNVTYGARKIDSLFNNRSLELSGANIKAASINEQILYNSQNGNSQTDYIISSIDSLNKNMSRLEEILGDDQPFYLTNVTNLDGKVIAEETVPLVSNKLALNIKRRR